MPTSGQPVPSAPMSAPQEEPAPGPKPDNLRGVLEKAEQLSQLALLFAEKIDGELLDYQTKEDTKDILLSVPKVLKLLKHEVSGTIDALENHIDAGRERETEMTKQLQEFSNLFGTYKDRVGADLTKSIEENKALQTENALLKQHNRLLQAKIDIWQDVMIKIRANQQRKENLEAIKKNLQAEDADIAKTVSDLLALEK